MKKLLVPLPALLLMALPAGTQAKAGQLDRTFGKGGKVLTLFGPGSATAGEPSTWLAWASGGKVIVASGETVLEFQPDGRLDRRFGSRGRVKVPAPDGRTVKTIGMTVDSRGRILIAGTATRSEASASVLVARYLSNGRSDPTFGDGGTVITDLGFPPPTPPPSSPSLRQPPIEGPIVEVTGLAVDSADRPLLTGSWIGGYQLCYPWFGYERRGTGYLARLTASGAVDQSFGEEEGAVTDPQDEFEFSPAAYNSGVLSAATQIRCIRGAPPVIALQRVDESGLPDQEFGLSGRIAMPPWSDEVTLTGERRGRLLLLIFRTGLDGQALLQRLRRDGSSDEGFNHGRGVDVPVESWDWYGALVSDRRGRPLLASRKRHGKKRWGILVSRRRHDGPIDRDFGKRGTASTLFPGEVRPTQILVGGGGKIVVGGTLHEGDRYGVAVVRYLGR